MRRGKTFLAGLLIASLILVTLEGIQRIRYPHVGFREMTNSFGFRSPEFNPEKEPGTIRILFLGSSTTFGVSNPLEKTFPFLVGDTLQVKLPEQKIETINIALPNKTSDWFIERIRETLFLEPDILVLLVGYNDSASVYETTIKVNDEGGLVLTPWYFQIHGFIARYSVLYVTLREKIALHLYGNPRFAFGSPKQIQQQELRTHENWFRHYPRLYRKNLETIAETAAAHEIKLIFIEPPLSLRRRREHPFYRKAFFRLKKELGEFASENRIPIISLRPFFSRTKEYFSSDGLHFTNEGNLAIAQAISDFFVNAQTKYFPERLVP